MPADRFANNASTTTTADPGSGGTTLAVTSASGFPSTAQFRIRVEDAPAGSGTNMELMTVTAGAGTASWTVTRGVESTTAVAHATGSAVTQIVTAGALETVSLENDFKQSVRVASTANVTVSGPGTAIDGVTLTSGDRVFLKDQTTASENGIYVFNGSAAAMTRATDADTAAKLADTAVIKVGQGTANADSVWQLVTDNPITLGTTALRFTKISPAYANQGVMASVPASSLYLPTGAKIENMPRTYSLINNQSTASTGVLKLNTLGILRAGDALSSLTFYAATTGGASLTHSWACIVRVSDRTILAVSPDNTTATWTANTGRTFTFNSTFTADKDELLWAGLMIAGTTLPTLYGVAHGGTITLGTPNIIGASTTGLTTPSTVGTVVTAPAAATTNSYCYAS